MTEHKMVVLGEGGVGKTALTIMLTSNHFVEYYDPTIESCYRRQVLVDGDVCILDILDTAGQDEYSALRSQWIRSGEAFVIVYDITSRASFEGAEIFRSQILRDLDVEKVPLILVGNKSDLEDSRQVTTAEGAELARSWGAAHIESSSKKRINVDEAFFGLVRRIRELEKEKRPKKLTKKQLMKQKLELGSCTIL